MTLVDNNFEQDVSRIIRNPDRNWYLGPNKVDETENYYHLGVNCSKYLELKVNLKTSVDKLKGTFMNIANCGLISDFNPLS